MKGSSCRTQNYETQTGEDLTCALFDWQVITLHVCVCVCGCVRLTGRMLLLGSQTQTSVAMGKGFFRINFKIKKNDLLLKCNWGNLNTDVSYVNADAVDQSCYCCFGMLHGGDGDVREWEGSKCPKMLPADVSSKLLAVLDYCRLIFIEDKSRFWDSMLRLDILLHAPLAFQCFSRCGVDVSLTFEHWCVCGSLISI